MQSSRNLNLDVVDRLQPGTEPRGGKRLLEREVTGDSGTRCPWNHRDAFCRRKKSTFTSTTRHPAEDALGAGLIDALLDGTARTRGSTFWADQRVW